MPRVSVRNSVRKPIRPRAGTRYSIRTQPVEWLTICSSRPLRPASSWVTEPTCSSGTSIARRSTGSCTLPSTSRVRTRGWPAVSSKPSRRISSSRTTSCSSPRPWTSQASGRSVSRTRIETLPTSSASSRSRTWRAVSLVPSLPASGEVLIPTHDRERGLVDGDHRQRPRVLGVGQRLADRHLFHPGDGDQFARAGLLGGHPLQRLGHEQLRDGRPGDAAVGLAPGDLLAGADRPVADPAERQAAEVGRGVEVGDVRLQRVVGVVLGRRDPLQHQVEQGGEVGSLDPLLERRPAGFGVGVDDREVDLVGVGVEVDEELVDLLDDLGDAGVGAVDLVDDEDHRQLRLQRLAQDEAGLRQRPLGGVDQQQDAVDHRQGALDLAAEVGVAGGVDDVELDVAAVDGGVLGEDRDPLLALEVHRVHHPLGDVLALAEGAGLPQHRVDQRRLAVVDVGDDRDVSEVVSCGSWVELRRVGDTASAVAEAAQSKTKPARWRASHCLSVVRDYEVCWTLAAAGPLGPSSDS